MTYVALMAAMGYTDVGHALSYTSKGRINLSIEAEGRYAVVTNLPHRTGGFDYNRTCAFVLQDTTILNGTLLCSDASSTDIAPGWGDIAFAPHHASQMIYATSARTWNNAAWAEFRLHRTVNGGVGWATVDGPRTFWDGGGNYTSIAIPYDSAANPDLYVYWASGQNAGTFNTARRSVTGGGAGTYSDIPGAQGNPGWCRIRDGLRYYNMFLLAANPMGAACKWTNDNAVTWNSYPIPPLGGGLEAMESFAVWVGNNINSVMIGGMPTGFPPAAGYIYRWDWGNPNWADKTGNLNSVYGVTRVHAMDRDSTGIA